MGICMRMAALVVNRGQGVDAHLVSGIEASNEVLSLYKAR